MKPLLRKILLSTKTVYLAAILSTISIIMSGILFITGMSLVSVLLFFVLGSMFSCISWVSFVLHSRVERGKQWTRYELNELSKQLSAMMTSVDEKLTEHIDRQLNEYKTQSFNTLVSLQNLKISLQKKPGGKFDD